MKVKILPRALEDLDRGRRFYARQGISLGDYFLDALFTDIDSLELYAGIHIGKYAFVIAAREWLSELDARSTQDSGRFPQRVASPASLL